MEADSDFQPPKKKRRKLDLAAQDRFAAAVSDENMAKIAKGYIHKKGEPYPPRSIHQLLAGLQRYTLEKHPNFPKLLDKQQTCFRDLRGTCDTVYRNLRCQGIGAEVRHAPIITPAEEEKLWLTAVLNINNPRSLQRAVFYSRAKLSASLCAYCA